jgi:hypothetical protein
VLKYLSGYDDIYLVKNTNICEYLQYLNKHEIKIYDVTKYGIRPFWSSFFFLISSGKYFFLKHTKT